MIEYKEVVARHGQTWDSIAYSVWGDGTELLFQHVMEANRTYSRTLAFDGGESVVVPLGDDAPVIVSSGDPDNQTVVTIISTPWG